MEGVFTAYSERQLETLEAKTWRRQLCDIEYETKSSFAALADDEGEKGELNVVAKKETLRLTMDSGAAQSVTGLKPAGEFNIHQPDAPARNDTYILSSGEVTGNIG